MKSKKETFAQMMATSTYHYDLRSVFDDLLTMSLCALSYNPLTGKFHDEDLYMATVGKYQTSDFRFQFPKLFAQLVAEMEERVDDSQGNDILGAYFEQHLCRKNSGQFFTPFHICTFMAETLRDGSKDSSRRQRVLDPTCGSGRMLLAGSKSLGKDHEYYGIDVDHTCVKMAAINLFLNGVFHSEVMWADALLPDDFHMSYRISFLPFGIFRIQHKEQSKLWHMYRNSFPEKKVVTKQPIVWPSQTSERHSGDGSQLKLF
ncbi:hypothetical protein CJD36_004395 [Flavipsychrobacter stenotrophus]|uniref:site-specific DNA-methyltransferase (adenine-specific) n=1 Tax=Flavipsychrobacter stenotrophus TaxID=2077091 RepID=A0A2S7T1C0_9BACT|nr:N-6 DNA methylase [Flavipsychrobacter stenotrophus]PQJ12990.1 hypothetical protein CJD36_004395 [Flavipsychrobacter stenotrophus]